ncbi:MAG TPA: biopolymer transporter ExbD [Candidatus Latescibacteria bacterium]|nr:biopolymer transporter ExbD [Candidatus Latescibacterota bacterium]
MRFQRRVKVGTSIPTSSMADIAFLLLIFFMVSTVFVRYRGLPVQLPWAQKIQRIETKRNITYIWVTADGRISIDDMPVRLPEVRSVVYEKLANNPRIIVSLKCDRKASYGLVSAIMEELKKAGALRINFATRREH